MHRDIERIARYAFELARHRNKKKRICSVTKSNAQGYGLVLWDRVFSHVAAEFSDIAGKGVVNPPATIFSAGMMLEHLVGSEAGAAVERAVAGVLAAGTVRAPDLGGRSTTQEVGDAVLPRLLESSNPLKWQYYGLVLWDRAFSHVAAEFPEIATESLLVDAAAMNFVRRPDPFDVVVASNLFGDILSGRCRNARWEPERRRCRVDAASMVSTSRVHSFGGIGRIPRPGKEQPMDTAPHPSKKRICSVMKSNA
ncbi:MAG TPA: isocitrate/isopropylmalate family dehydrogenase [Bryobacteraceae bacterium]